MYLQIPFLSLGDVGSRSQVWSGESCSGPYVVEDVSVDGILHRRLVFLHHQGLVQSEARLKTGRCLLTFTFLIRRRSQV